MRAFPIPYGVIGAGAWGTALAQMLSSDGSTVRVWAFEADVVTGINADHCNHLYLPDIALSPLVSATKAIDALTECATLLAVAPAQHMARILGDLPDHGQPLVLCSKGMEQPTGRLMNDVVADRGWSGPVAVLSGPTFATEVARGLPGAVTLAAATMAEAQDLAARLARPTFRPYASDDIVGAEIGGVVKNVLAIACGVVDGAGLGQNARAALISRGFAEMVRYGLARGGRLETLAGLAGLGDLVLTCSSTASRNFSLGRGLGEGRSAAELLADRLTVAEGAFSAPVLAADAKARGIDMPIVDAVARLVAGETTVAQMVGALLARPLTGEGWQRLG
jgi:glycerol-3-phosphate dehydrogenase (NAD(P)+)